MAGFQDILGHEMIKDHFRKAIENHKVSHAYILAGERRDGAQVPGECVCHDPAL